MGAIDADELKSIEKPFDPIYFNLHGFWIRDIKMIYGHISVVYSLCNLSVHVMCILILFLFV